MLVGLQRQGKLRLYLLSTDAIDTNHMSIADTLVFIQLVSFRPSADRPQDPGNRQSKDIGNGLSALNSKAQYESISSSTKPMTLRRKVTVIAIVE